MQKQEIEKLAETWMRNQTGFIHEKKDGFLAGFTSAMELQKSEWTPVEEGLPFKDGNSSIYCLVDTKDHGIIVRPYNEYHHCWDQEDGDDHYTQEIGGKVTAWMNLPESFKKD